MIINAGTKPKIKSCLDEICKSFIRIGAEQDNIKDILARMEDEFNIPKKVGRRIANVYHEQNYQDEVANHQTFTEAYESLIDDE
jgi:hypothetical protein